MMQLYFNYIGSLVFDSIDNNFLLRFKCIFIGIVSDKRIQNFRLKSFVLYLF